MNDDELRGADPAADLPPADPARVADLLEAAVSTTRPTPDVTAGASEGGVRAAAASARRRPWVRALTVAAAAAVVAAAAVPVVRSLAPEPATTTLTLTNTDPLTASCLPVADILRDSRTQTAFSARATAVVGERVSLDVERVYRGEPGDRVVIDAPPADARAAATIGGFPFEVGSDYLVTASDGVVAVCGASGPATPELQAEYDRAFG
ncbi:hypothetical protein [Quadrisphaera setariae]|uniref:Uncharacterized protein n=1 Tax=Quadrisphaera setariae TaxID=2593304 RepID=A0A5C8ZDC0_9ACTN|nr:hypothetical protein [Quadrisphaera setariae]TXR56085.1 hypothetical protein FMM08_11645 [Quadrisphaera setariae]